MGRIPPSPGRIRPIQQGSRRPTSRVKHSHLNPDKRSQHSLESHNPRKQAVHNRSQPSPPGQPPQNQPEPAQPPQPGQAQPPQPEAAQPGQGQPSRDNPGQGQARGDEGGSPQGQTPQTRPPQNLPLRTEGPAGEAPLGRGENRQGRPAPLPSPWASGQPPQNVQRQAEKYLESEPLPPEVRNLVRRYFELPP
jgi:hypothetical protein